MTFAKQFHAERKKLETELTSMLQNLSNEHALSGSADTLDTIDGIKRELEQIQYLKTNGAILRSELSNIEYGERNNSYFLSLEKKNAVKKIISALKLDNDCIIYDKQEIQNELGKYYSGLYSDDTNLNDKNFSDFIQEGPTLNEFEQSVCEGEITEAECLAALKTFKNSKTPGIDGLPAEFYKFFGTDIKVARLKSINYALIKGELSLDQRRELISLIPKKDNERLRIKNWRPISLLTTDYKLITKCLAKRILKVIDKLISSDQTGYLKGRYVGENIRTVHDVITYLHERNLSGMLLLIDFEKAFDTVKWSAIDKTLSFFNFGQSFRNWIKIIYHNVQSAVLNNGYISKFFEPTKGVRQGCPLSCYLFILKLLLKS